MESNPAPARGRPKGDKRSRTRAALIAAAAELVREKGYERTTQDDVARRAGMSRGAVQGNFKDKDELFLAVAVSRWAPVIPPFAPGQSLAERMRAVADALIAALPDRRAAAIGFTSFQTYALTHEAVRREVVQIIGEIYRQAAEGLAAAYPESELGMPAATFVRVVHALSEGLTYQAFMVPEHVADAVVHAAFDALARPPRVL